LLVPVVKFPDQAILGVAVKFGEVAI